MLKLTRFCRKFTTQQSTTTTAQWHKPQSNDGQNTTTGISVYNCAARDKVPLVLCNGGNYATWYTCGPTVYDSMHLGHASCYVKLDIVQRILREHFHLNLVTAMNITDIDDKIIQKSRESGRNWRELARSYEAEFWADMRKLNVSEPNVKIRVTEHIPQIVAFIEAIVAKGHAYVGADSSVYFDVRKFPAYGKLQKLNRDDLENSQTTSKSEHKLAAADFALWKSARQSDDEGGVSWPSPWGAGRPGWHIECSVLASMIFGRHLDFHAGGLDLKFPHHENEEAQSCVYHNATQWVNYWLHTGQLSVKGQTAKMSKSLKNTVSVDALLARYTSDEFRMACALSNYRNSVEYSDELMATATNTLQRFHSFRADCQAYLSGLKRPAANLDAGLISSNLHSAKNQIDACLRDDFDTARAVGVLLELTASISRCINAAGACAAVQLQTGRSGLDTVAAVDNFVQRNLRNFGFAFAESSSAVAKSEEPLLDLNGLVEDILASRRVIRDRAVASTNKEDLFRVCDELRNCLRRHGIDIKDHSRGSSWSFSSSKK